MMDENEKIAILEAIARDPKAYPSARVSAIRALDERRRAAEAKEPPADDGFAGLYEVDDARRQRSTR